MHGVLIIQLQTIITTALPTITRQFQASQADYNWVGSAYMLAAACMFTPIAGYVFLYSLAVF